jgi:hypothetical protein
VSRFDDWFPADRLPICRWETEGVEFPADSAYVEWVWSGVLGPTATLAYRRLSSLVANGVREVDLVDLSAGLGVGLRRPGRNSTLARALGRLVIFGAARPDGDALAVRAGLPPLEVHRLARLGPTAELVHRRALTRRLPNAANPPARPTGPEATPTRTPEARLLAPTPPAGGPHPVDQIPAARPLRLRQR